MKIVTLAEINAASFVPKAPCESKSPLSSPQREFSAAARSRDSESGTAEHWVSCGTDHVHDHPIKRSLNRSNSFMSSMMAAMGYEKSAAPMTSVG